MNSTFSLGTVRGIPIGVNLSVLLVAGLIAWSLAVQLLPAQVPGLPSQAYWAAGVVAAVLFFASLLLHELSHAFVARREGLRVTGITLWLLGGVARMSGEARSPGAEARIAGVGPLTSLGLALAFGLLALAIGALPAGEVTAITAASAGWLALVNLVLGVFNLLPGVPLDGGRIARAVLWRWRRDKSAATRSATRLGQLLGYGMVAIGFLRVALGDIGGLWFVILGFFLASAAGAERSHSLATDALRGVRVGDVMTRDLPRVPGTLTVETFLLAALGESRSSTWLIAGPGGTVTGLLGLEQLRMSRGDDRRTTRVGEVALPLEDVEVTHPDELVTDLLTRLEAGALPRALVRDATGPLGGIVGVVTPEDVSRAIEMGQLRGAASGIRPAIIDRPRRWPRTRG